MTSGRQHGLADRGHSIAVGAAAAAAIISEMVSQAGGLYAGRLGVRCFGLPEWVNVTDPITRTTLTVPEEGISTEVVRRELRRVRRRRAEHYCAAAASDERAGFSLTAALEWRHAAELYGPDWIEADRCWQHWERLMQLPRRLAMPICDAAAQNYRDRAATAEQELHWENADRYPPMPAISAAA